MFRFLLLTPRGHITQIACSNDQKACVFGLTRQSQTKKLFLTGYHPRAQWRRSKLTSYRHPLKEVYRHSLKIAAWESGFQLFCIQMLMETFIINLSFNMSSLFKVYNRDLPINWVHFLAFRSADLFPINKLIWEYLTYMIIEWPE